MARLATFLIVDDDPIFLAVAESIVASLGVASITTAADAAVGLEALCQAPSPFNFIVLDLNMPGLDGLGFLRAAAALGFNGHVIISSGEPAAVLRSARRMGELLGISVIGAIKKPLSAAAVQALIGQVLELELELEPQPIMPSISRAASVGSLEALELVPHYQLQHDARDGSIRGLEALIRAKAPDGQFHGPGRVFAPIHDHAELVATTLAIAGKVLDDMKRWQDEGILCRTSINLDAKVAEDPQVGPELVRLVRDKGIGPQFVCLELTESALPNDMTRLIEALARLRMAGFHLSLDDYGTGGSNFELLGLCPFTELKIDGSIIRSAATEAIAYRFLESAVAMAGELDIDVVAEAVETEPQLELARRVGVKLIQGFLLSMPRSADETTGSHRTSLDLKGMRNEFPKTSTP